MLKTLRLGKDFAVPLDFATEGLGVVGMRGSGKSNAEARWCEILHKAKIPFVVVDPKGDWGGIRSSADGKSPGLPIPVFGGLYGDFPLDEHLGARIADLLVDENMSAILDVSRMSHAARARFLTDFFEQLMDRHQREPHVRCVILEEAHRYIPQKVPAELTRVKEAAAAILLEGRSWGLGCWAATQRPARLNKDVMEEVGTIFVFRLGVAATNDRRTVTGWFQDQDNVKEIASTFTTLGNGEAWVHGPATLGITQRIQMDRRTTFDSAATPLVGASGKPIATMATINSAAIIEALSDAIDKAKANDPKELKKELSVVRAELAKRPSAEDASELEWWRRFSTTFAPEQLPEIGAPFTSLGPLYLSGAAPKPETIEVPFVPDEILDKRDLVVEGASALAKLIADMSNGLDAAVKEADKAKKSGPKSAPVLPVMVKTTKAALAEVRHVRIPRETPVADDPGDGSLPKGERVVLVGIAQSGTAGATKGQLVLLSGLKSSSVKTYVQRLRNKGLVTSTGARFFTTEEARSMLGHFEPLPSGEALRSYWVNSIPEGESKILSALISVYPHTVTREELVERTGYEPSTVKTYVQRLKVRELVVIDDGNPRVSALLFDEVA